MSTINLTITPAQGWALAFTGPLDTPISIEKKQGGSISQGCIYAGTPPAGLMGHDLTIGQVRNFTIKAGENIYIKCMDGLSGMENNIFAITS